MDHPVAARGFESLGSPSDRAGFDPAGQRRCRPRLAGLAQDTKRLGAVGQNDRFFAVVRDVVSQGEVFRYLPPGNNQGQDDQDQE